MGMHPSPAHSRPAVLFHACVPADRKHPGNNEAHLCYDNAAVQAGRRLLQGAPYRYALTAYCGGSPQQDHIDMVLTDAAGTAIWQLQGKHDCAKQQEPSVIAGCDDPDAGVHRSKSTNAVT